MRNSDLVVDTQNFFYKQNKYKFHINGYKSAKNQLKQRKRIVTKK